MATTHASTNRTGIDRMALWESNGWRYLGWASWLNGHRLPLSGGSGGGSSTLRRGSTGAKVTALQKRLNHDYFSYSDLDVDGKFGPATERVVREFQRRAGLHVDGIVGPATRGALGL
jgi:hypothetical protein